MKRVRGRKSTPPDLKTLIDPTQWRRVRGGYWPKNDQCRICGRKLIRGPSVNFHHLVPKTKGGTHRFAIHMMCHRKLHQVFTEKEMADFFFTFPRLLSSPEIKTFVTWARKQDLEKI